MSKPWSTFASVDQLVALASADIDAVPFIAVERKARDVSVSCWEKVFFTQSRLRAPGRIDIVGHLRHHALVAELAGMGEHLRAVDLEALAELMAVPAISFFSTALRSTSGTFRRSRPLKWSGSKATITILVDLPRSSFCSTEKSVVPPAEGNLAVDDG
ncbi:hypothetical protein ACVWZM_000270 [Bradyrhizobium sp. USDA 4501]